MYSDGFSGNPRREHVIVAFWPPNMTGRVGTVTAMGLTETDAHTGPSEPLPGGAGPPNAPKPPNPPNPPPAHSPVAGPPWAQYSGKYGNYGYGPGGYGYGYTAYGYGMSFAKGDEAKGKGRGMSRGKGWKSKEGHRKDSKDAKEGEKDALEKPEKEEEAAPRVKDEVFEEIRAVLSVNACALVSCSASAELMVKGHEEAVLQHQFFDARVRQHLHALHGSGGRARLKAALQMVHQCTMNKTRQDVKNWPAYLVTLLKKFDADAAAAPPQDRQERLEEKKGVGSASTASTTPEKLSGQEAFGVEEAFPNFSFMESESEEEGDEEPREQRWDLQVPRVTAPPPKQPYREPQMSSLEILEAPGFGGPEVPELGTANVRNAEELGRVGHGPRAVAPVGPNALPAGTGPGANLSLSSANGLPPAHPCAFPFGDKTVSAVSGNIGFGLQTTPTMPAGERLGPMSSWSSRLLEPLRLSRCGCRDSDGNAKDLSAVSGRSSPGDGCPEVGGLLEPQRCSPCTPPRPASVTTKTESAIPLASFTKNSLASEAQRDAEMNRVKLWILQRPLQQTERSLLEWEKKRSVKVDGFSSCPTDACVEQVFKASRNEFSRYCAMALWRVLGDIGDKSGESACGILVREGQGLQTPVLGRLSFGALVLALADSSSSSGAAASRLRYRLLRGNGPKEGWVSIRCKGKALLAEADHADLAPPEQSMPFPAIGLGKPNLGAASGWASWHGFKRVANFRDVADSSPGNHPIRCRNGKVLRRGMLFRSGHFAAATKEDLAVLQALQLRTYVDLREGRDFEGADAEVHHVLFPPSPSTTARGAPPAPVPAGGRRLWCPVTKDLRLRGSTADEKLNAVPESDRKAWTSWWFQRLTRCLAALAVNSPPLRHAVTFRRTEGFSVESRAFRVAEAAQHEGKARASAKALGRKPRLLGFVLDKQISATARSRRGLTEWDEVNFSFTNTNKESKEMISTDAQWENRARKVR
ncbi:unnamed protein product [Symbiodinium microadriaticum]|nr:unnamed protein product [Symbiodinium microadriaticum]